jgi:hypothetical protein
VRASTFSVRPYGYSSYDQGLIHQGLTCLNSSTSQVEGLNSRSLISRIPEMREVNGVLTPFTRRHVSTCLSPGPTLWFCHVSLVPSFDTSQLRFPKRCLLCIPTPEVSRSQTPRYSLSQLATSGFRDFGSPDFATFPSECLDSPTTKTQNSDSPKWLMTSFPRTYIASRDFGNLGTKVSTSYPPKR